MNHSRFESGQHPRQPLSAVAILKRIVGRLREAWPSVEIELRADAGFAVPEIYNYCEKEGIGYTIGLISNPRLEALAQELLERERESQTGVRAESGREGEAGFEWLIPGSQLGVLAEGHLQGGGATEGHKHTLCGEQPL